MNLARLDVVGLRNLESLSLEPGGGLNFLVGPNGSGKSSVLEAIYLLGRARSFRASRTARLIRHGESSLTVVGQLQDGASRLRTIGLRIAKREREIHLAGREVRSGAELARAFPLLVIQPSSIALLEGAPGLRRQFMDFGAFHQDAGYLDRWRRYTKALYQRNALLRERRIGELAPWNHEMVRYGKMIEEARERYFDLLDPIFREIGGLFFPSQTLTLLRQPGWDLARGLDHQLEESVGAELRCGYTLAGPHRGDYSIALGGHPAREYQSRGQLKLLVYALLLAQARLMESRGCEGIGSVLIDDVTSELDTDNRRILLEWLSNRPTQHFVTATSRNSIEAGLRGDFTLFHLAQGRITQE